MRTTALICYLVSALAILACGCGRNMETIKALNLDETENSAPASSPISAELLPFTGPAMDPNLGACLTMYKQQRFDSCRVSLEKMLASEPGRWRVLYLLGLAHYRTQEYDMAERSLLASLRFVGSEKSNRALIYLALGNSLERKTDYARAKQHFVTALNLDPTCLEAKTGLQRLTALTSVSGR